MALIVKPLSDLFSEHVTPPCGGNADINTVICVFHRVEDPGGDEPDPTLETSQIRIRNLPAKKPIRILSSKKNGSIIRLK